MKVITPINAEAKNAEAVYAFPHASSQHGDLLIKHRDNFIFYLYNEYVRP